MSAELAELNGEQLAERIRAEHRDFCASRDIAISAGRITIERAIRLGEYFEAAADRFPGNYEEWVERNFAGEISVRTAHRYRKCFAKRDQYLSENPTLHWQKEAYVETEVLPPPESEEKQRTAQRPLYQLRLVLDTAKPLHTWPRIELLDFLKQTARVVELRTEAEQLLAQA